MKDCWNEDPNTRPSFDDLHEITTRFVEDEVMFSALDIIVSLHVWYAHGSVLQRLVNST